MSKLNTMFASIGLATVALTGCGNPEEVKSYHITVRVGEKVATITMQGNVILCTTDLKEIPRVSRVENNGNNKTQLIKDNDFIGPGFTPYRSGDAQYTTIYANGMLVARVINKGGNGTREIMENEGKIICDLLKGIPGKQHTEYVHYKDIGNAKQ